MNADITNDKTAQALLQIIARRFAKSGDISQLEQALKELEEKVETLEERVDNIQDVETYEGEYTVTPSPQKQVLETANLLMEDDVTVTEIPYFEVGNTAGGNTVYIGADIEIH